MANETEQGSTAAKILETVADVHIKELKALRRDGDEFVQRVRNLPFGQSEQTVDARKKFQEAIMWLGMELKRLNDMGYGENPYPNSKNPENTIIDPTADSLKL